MIRDVECPYCNKMFSKKGIGSHIWRCHGEGQGFSPTKGKSHTPWNKGLTKETDDRVRKHSEGLRKSRPSYQTDIDDDGKLYQKFLNKRINASHENIPFDLSFEEFCKLCSDAGLVSSDLGFTGNYYVLARYEDKGGYSVSNCRFITQLENAHERDSHLTFTRLRCVEDDITFDSVKSASEYYGICADCIFTAIKQNSGSVPKIHRTFVKI